VLAARTINNHLKERLQQQRKRQWWKQWWWRWKQREWRQHATAYLNVAALLIVVCAHAIAVASMAQTINNQLKELKSNDNDDGNKDNGGNLLLPTPLPQPWWLLSVPTPLLLRPVSSRPLRRNDVCLHPALDVLPAATATTAAAAAPLPACCRCRRRAITAAAAAVVLSQLLPLTQYCRCHGAAKLAAATAALPSWPPLPPR
jgi:hypothetical protein